MENILKIFALKIEKEPNKQVNAQSHHKYKKLKALAAIVNLLDLKTVTRYVLRLKSNEIAHNMETIQLYTLGKLFKFPRDMKCRYIV